MTPIKLVLITALFVAFSENTAIASLPTVPTESRGDWDPPEVKAGLGDAQTAQHDIQTAVPGSQADIDARARLAKDEKVIADAGLKYKDNFPAQKSVVNAFNKLGDYDKAMPFADHAVDLAEKKGDSRQMTMALTLRGDVNFGMKNYDAALKDAEAALKLDPKNKAALELKYQAAGRAARGEPGPAGYGGDLGATGDYKGPAARPAAPDAALNGGRGGIAANSMAPVDPRKAAAVLTETPERQRAEALVREAAQRMSIDPASALPLADKAVAADPNDPRAYYTRAAARRAAGDLMGAMADLDKTLALNPGDAAAHAAKASVAVAMGRSVDEVKKEFLAAGRDASEFADYYRDQVTALSGKPAAKDAAAGAAGSAPGGPWAARGGLPARIRENAGALILLGLGLVVFGGALLFQTRKRMGDGRRDG